MSMGGRCSMIQVECEVGGYLGQAFYHHDAAFPYEEVDSVYDKKYLLSMGGGRDENNDELLDIFMWNSPVLDYAWWDYQQLEVNVRCFVPMKMKQLLRHVDDPDQIESYIRKYNLDIILCRVGNWKDSQPVITLLSSSERNPDSFLVNQGLVVPEEVMTQLKTQEPVTGLASQLDPSIHLFVLDELDFKNFDDISLTCYNITSEKTFFVDIARTGTGQKYANL